MLAAAAAARDAGARSRGDADGPVFATVADGIGSLPAALVAASGADDPAAHAGARPAADGVRLRARRRPGRGAGAADADAVIVTAPAPKAARLLAEAVPGAVEPLQGIPYASMAVVAMAFPAQDVAAGSGLLVPPVAGRLVKGVTVSSAKWPHLAGDALLVRASVGRFRDESELQRDDDDLTAAVVADVADLLDLDRPEPLETRLVRWGGGLPQYLVGHPARVAAIRAAVAEVPGLAIAGAAFEGVGVPGLHPRRLPRRRRAAAEPAGAARPWSTGMRGAGAFRWARAGVDCSVTISHHPTSADSTPVAPRTPRCLRHRVWMAACDRLPRGPRSSACGPTAGRRTPAPLTSGARRGRGGQ